MTKCDWPIRNGGEAVLSNKTEESLEWFSDHVSRLGKQSHHTAQEYPKAVELIVDLLRSGERLYPEDVRSFFAGKGWSEEDARDMGEMADTIDCVLRYLNLISRPQ
ncbi:MAG TPA: hypothetical protein VFT63_03240 [bacterium]|nr:hypothetical protein [bacterium]